MPSNNPRYVHLKKITAQEQTTVPVFVLNDDFQNKFDFQHTSFKFSKKLLKTKW